MNYLLYIINVKFLKHVNSIMVMQNNVPVLKTYITVLVSATTLKRMGRKREFKCRGYRQLGRQNSTGKKGIQVKETWVLFFSTILYTLHISKQKREGKNFKKFKNPNTKLYQYLCCGNAIYLQTETERKRGLHASL